MRSYSEDFKRNAVEKLLSPGSKGLSLIAKECGIPTSTLYGWKDAYAIKSVMKKTINLHKMSREEKLEILIKAGSLSELELGAYLREKGLHTGDLELIRKDIINIPESPKKPLNDPEVARLKKEIERTNKDLKRKDKALAEYAARVVLLKKSHEIWGVPEDDE